MDPERPDADIYLDTAFVVNAVFRQVQDSSACLEATHWLIEERRTVYFSQILRLEFAQALRRLATRQRLPSEIVGQFDLERWSDVGVRHRWMTFGFNELARYINGLPAAVELPLERAILDESAQHMIRYSLGSLDAAQLATALHYGIPVFWTCDDHFTRVDDLFVEIIRDPD